MTCEGRSRKRPWSNQWHRWDFLALGACNDNGHPDRYCELSNEITITYLFLVICFNNIKIVERIISIVFTSDIQFVTIFVSWTLPLLAASSVTCHSTRPPTHPLLLATPLGIIPGTISTSAWRIWGNFSLRRVGVSTNNFTGRLHDEVRKATASTSAFGFCDSAVQAFSYLLLN